MTYHTMNICELRNRLITHDGEGVMVANLLGSLEEKDNPEQILMDGLARKKTSFIRGTRKWHEVLVPLKPAAQALKTEEEGCQESLLVQVGACNLRCWYCFVDVNLITGAKDYTKELSVDKVVEYLKDHQQYKILHISGGEPLLSIEFIQKLQTQLKACLDKKAPYLWMETNLTVSPYDLPIECYSKLETVFQNKKVGVVGCFRSFVPDEYSKTIGGLDVNWYKQFSVARDLTSLGADFYSTVVLMTNDFRNVESKIKYFFDTYIKYLGEQKMNRLLPIEIRRYTPTKERLDDEYEKLIQSQYDVLPIWKDIYKSYLGKQELQEQLIKEKIYERNIL
ncbi:MAG: radical SAM protein [bacterium]|nr:radical SAM protein [bacterium]MBU1917448.1 radical SAM protein [bacterium]